jgi:hypothetical protein
MDGMRLWSLHPEYLDVHGLVAVWREGLLARSVLQGGTRGYRSHPQLQRFRSQLDPMEAVDAYLEGILEESLRRGYSFDGSKIRLGLHPPRIPVTEGQLHYEWEHLLRKLARRDVPRFECLKDLPAPRAHPRFVVVEGGIASWERITPAGGRDGNSGTGGN